MNKIDINKQHNIKLLLFPDNQPHVNIENINEGDLVDVKVSLKSSLDVMHLLQCSSAIDHKFAEKGTLTIPYLMGARFDRIMNDGDSFDLKVIADLINYCNFKKVILFDVHSDVATALIKNSVNISNKNLVTSYDKKDSILICPDAGAVKKVSKYLEINKNIKNVVYCNKTRDLSNGNLTIKVLEPELCENQNCVIIDDLCDGGGTFLGIAKQIKPKHLTLIVTHGLFSKGVKDLLTEFDDIITSDSYYTGINKNIKIVNVI